MSHSLSKFKEKFELWTKFMQAGKTAEIQKEIKRLAESEQDYYHIIFCSNNLFLTTQTEQRITQTFEEDLNQKLGSEFANKLKAIVFSSKNKHCSKLEQLLDQIEDCRAILCCSHKQRFKQITLFLKFLRGKKFYIWIDEMHMDLDMSWEYLCKLSSFPWVEKMIGITATPDSIFKKFGNDFKITVKPMPACDDEKYYGFDDIQQHTIDIDAKNYIIPEYFYEENFKKYTTSKAISQTGRCALSSKVDNALYLNTLLINEELKCDKNDVLFAPGQRYKISHEAICDILLDHGFYVFVFNSDGSKLYTHKNVDIDIEEITSKWGEKGHLGNVMGRIKDEMKLQDRPIGITGYLSIGQGNTLCDYATEFYITKSVFGYKSALKGKDSHAFVTQIFGRSFGNLKHRNEFKGSEVFMRSKFATEIESNILSGALGELALNTGITEYSNSCLKQAKRTTKRGLENKWSESKSKPENIAMEYKSTVKYSNKIIKFSIGKKIIAELKNETGKSGKIKIFEEYLESKKIDCERLRGLCANGKHRISVIWSSTKKNIFDGAVFEAIKTYTGTKKEYDILLTKIRTKTESDLNHKVFVLYSDEEKENGKCYAVLTE